MVTVEFHTIKQFLLLITCIHRLVMELNADMKRFSNQLIQM